MPVAPRPEPAADAATPDAGLFARLRPRLAGLAYRMLGSRAEAEDIVQEAWLRWHGADGTRIRSAEAWLATVVTRLSLDRLRQAAAERARYVGPWLPEPIAGSPVELPDPGAAPDRAIDLADDLSMAFMVLLERLSPEERAAFLLREAFDGDYAAIAELLGKSEAACRQIVHRARERVRAGRPRYAASRAAGRRLVERFVAVVNGGDEAGLRALLADDAIWAADGGGRVLAARNVIRGAERIVRLVRGVRRKAPARVTYRAAIVNGEPGAIGLLGGALASVISFETDGERITAVYHQMNPDKLAAVREAIGHADEGGQA